MATSDSALSPSGNAAAVPKKAGWLLSTAATTAAWLWLVFTDVLLKLLGFPRFHRFLRAVPTNPWFRVNQRIQALMCAAVQRATAYRFKHPRCLQRSAALLLILRLLGIPVEMVIGVQKVPFQAHAWVELDGAVINDRPAVKRSFVAMERF